MPAPVFYAVVKANGTSLFQKMVNGYRIAQVFEIEQEAHTALSKYRTQRPHDQQVLTVVTLGVR